MAFNALFLHQYSLVSKSHWSKWQENVQKANNSILKMQKCTVFNGTGEKIQLQNLFTFDHCALGCYCMATLQHLSCEIREEMYFRPSWEFRVWKIRNKKKMHGEQERSLLLIRLSWHAFHYLQQYQEDQSAIMNQCLTLQRKKCIQPAKDGLNTTMLFPVPSFQPH